VTPFYKLQIAKGLLLLKCRGQVAHCELNFPSVLKGSGMTYMRISLASIEVLNHKSLLDAWRIYGGPGSRFESFTVRRPLTSSQVRRLPAGLRERLK
jgi:hypothetical protein